jgi:hypothetical protein
VEGSALRGWLTAGDRIAGAVLVALATLVLWESRTLPLGSFNSPGPAFMPIVLASIVLATGVLLVITSGPQRLTGDGSWSEWRRVLIIMATAAFGAWALERIGYRLTVLIVLGFLIGVVERRNPIATAIFAAAMAFGTFYVFDGVLRVQLPRGPFNF